MQAHNITKTKKIKASLHTITIFITLHLICIYKGVK